MRVLGPRPWMRVLGPQATVMAYGAERKLLLGADDLIQAGEGRILGQRLGGVLEALARNRLLEVLRRLPPGHVDEAEVHSRRDRAVERRVHVTRLLLQVVAGGVPAAEELLLGLFRHLERVDQDEGLGAVAHGVEGTPGTSCRRASATSWWTSWIAIEPSPTADATRFTEAWRTSPAANTPGTLVSSRNGLRASGQPESSPRSAPVSTNPRESRASSGGSQAGRARTPIIRKRPCAPPVSSCPPPSRSTSRRSHPSSPPPPTTSARSRTSTF